MNKERTGYCTRVIPQLANRTVINLALRSGKNLEILENFKIRLGV